MELKPSTPRLVRDREASIAGCEAPTAQFAYEDQGQAVGEACRTGGRTARGQYADRDGPPDRHRRKRPVAGSPDGGVRAHGAEGPGRCVRPGAGGPARPAGRERGVNRLRRGLANATLQQRLVAVQLFCELLMEEGVRESNPVGRDRYTPRGGFGGGRRGWCPGRPGCRGFPVSNSGRTS